MDPERQVAQLGQRCRPLPMQVQAPSDGRVTAVPQRVGDLQLETERDEPLLGAVMEVSLDPPALAIPGLDDPCARGAHLLELRSTSAVSRSFSTARRIAPATEAIRPGPRAGSRLDDRRLPDAVSLQHRHGLARAVFGEFTADRPAATNGR